MFDGLKNKLSNIFKNANNKGVLDQKDVETSLREIRITLLEADVALSVVKSISEEILEETQNQEKISKLLPVHILLKIVKEKILKVLNTHHQAFSLSKGDIILMCGLQGSGKTTTCVKLANFIKSKFSKSSLLVSLDVYRPAAREQLSIFATKSNVDTFSFSSQNPIEILREAMNHFRTNSDKYDCLIIDTAGRSEIDETMMTELSQISEISKPNHKILVVDSMLGQSSIGIAKGFDEAISISGTILTKIDSDTRGGAGLSISYVTQKPIYFVGTGEKSSEIEEFSPERITSQILGQGDIIALVEKVMENNQDAKLMEEKIKSGKFDLEDMEKQFEMMSRMGGLSKIIGMLPVGGLTEEKKSQGMNQIKKIKAILQSMTKKEKRDPKIINSSRKIRISKGSGTTVADLNTLLKQHEQMAKMMKGFSNNRMLNRFIKK
jgi:signal recognition particle subunit SRP54